MLEPYARKPARTVLRGGGDGNAASLPDQQTGAAIPASRGMKVSQAAPAAELGRSALKEGAVNAAVAVEPAAGAVTVRLAAHVHRSDGRPGFDPGSGWSRKMLGPAVRTNIATDRVKE